ncbi:hypothetical protein LVE72_02345 [Mycobacteroides abscessus subsp. abscessus]|uniref:hypothetical protein n=1 Tax=Mycobacteroides abscessus TaxID=36809 RepID=UPI001E3F2D6C|nr:hypothetical protein [Mycobacteroides abscessus]UHJ77430.1 hypothetical protein LVE72_02345 [Mycobacteroides abscessus subsp. abscessus]
MSTVYPGGSLSGGSEETQDLSSMRDMSPPGDAIAGDCEQEGYQRGRAYYKPVHDFGHSHASVRVGPIEFKADGKGAAAALAVGVVGSVVMIAVSAYCGLPLVAVMVTGVLPLVLAFVLILTGLLTS